MEQTIKTTQNLKFKALKSGELAYFFEQLSLFTKSGIAVWESLQIIAENNKKDKNYPLYSYLYNSVSDGMFLSAAMDDAKCFPDYALGMIEVSEQTGRVDEVCASLSSFYTDKDKLSRSVRSSVIYPLCMAGMVFAVIFILLIQVMPIFEQVFAQLGLAMNSVSSTLMGVGELLNTYAFALIIFFVALVLFFSILRITPFGKNLLSSLYEVSPFTKRLSVSQNANRFAFSMSLILESGLDIISALEFSMLTTSSKQYRQKLKGALNALKDGESLDTALINARVFDPSYNGLISAGAKSGASGEMFMSIAEKYHKETQNRIDKILAIIEPSLVAFLCLMVGMVMLSVMLPLVGILSGM